LSGLILLGVTSFAATLALLGLRLHHFKEPPSAC